jgi:hypothetical protein
MLMQVSAMAAGLAATTLVVGVAVTGCGSNKSSSPSSTTSSSTSTSSASPSSTAPTSSSGAAQPSDYTNLLIKATDIVVPGDSFNGPQTKHPPFEMKGISGTFTNQSGSRTLSDNLFIYADPGEAGRERDSLISSVTNPQTGVIRVTPTPADVGTGGALIVGPSIAFGSPSETEVIFSEGKVLAQVIFEGAQNDPVPADIAMDVARKQDAAIKAGLPA